MNGPNRVKLKSRLQSRVRVRVRVRGTYRPKEEFTSLFLDTRPYTSMLKTALNGYIMTVIPTVKSWVSAVSGLDLQKQKS